MFVHIYKQQMLGLCTQHYIRNYTECVTFREVHDLVQSAACCNLYLSARIASTLW